MLISDWSSDVCSSDLSSPYDGHQGQCPLAHRSSPTGTRPRNRETATTRRSRSSPTTASGAGVSRCPDPRIGLRRGNETVARTDSRRLTPRSEEHTSELQSLMRNSYAVFCLKHKKTPTQHQ